MCVQFEHGSTASLFFLVLTMVNSCLLRAQSGTSSALSGEVTDPNGAAVPRATVTITDTDTRATRTSETDATGHFLFSQINPGTYQVTVEAMGFGVSKSEPTPVGVGRTVALNFVLHVQSSNQTVEVTAQQGLLSLDNPNTTTTIEAKTIKSLPNPGQDLTYLAQFAQGALMNTAGSSNDAKAAGGYGNVEFNGLPATSNGYILDGYDTNDPWLGLNIGLSTNLVIGLDAVQEATVNTNSFSVDQGRYAVAQVNYFTKSGTNAFHGDVYEIWNGSLFNCGELLPSRQRHTRQHRQESHALPSMNSASASAGRFAGTSSSSSDTTRASASLCRSSPKSHFRLLPISNMFSGNWPLAEPILSPEHLSRHSPRRFRSIRRCSRSCRRRAGRRCPLSDARSEPMAMAAPASARPLSTTAIAKT